MLLRRRLSTIGVLLLAIVLLIGAPAQAQDESASPILLIAGQGLIGDQRTLAGALANRIRSASAEAGIEADIQEHYAETEQPLPPDVPLTIEVAPCLDPGCDLLIRFWVHAPSSELVISRDLFDELANTAPLQVTYQAEAQETEQFLEAALNLFSYAAESCPVTPVETSPPTPLSVNGEGTINANSAYLLDFYAALCERAGNDYPAALEYLADMQAGMIAGGAPWQHFRLRDIYEADTLALNFDFDAALALDSRAIRQTALGRDQLSSRLLPELYLLRGQHTLYVYEWDAAVRDYNTALASDNHPARAFYYRGVLYYTRNAWEAARADLERYVELESDATSPLLAQAGRYLDDLRELMATGN